MSRILFLSDADICEGPMAQALAESRAPEGVDVAAAGFRASSCLCPDAVAAMDSIGIDLSSRIPFSFEDIRRECFDVVVFLTPVAEEEYPTMPGSPVMVQWSLKSRHSSLSGRCDASLCRDELRLLIDVLFDQGYLRSLVESRRKSLLMIENISDGIIAHDMNRIIFFVNPAAEMITGRSSESLLNLDCHEVFDGKFCNGPCVFASDADKSQRALSRSEEFEIIRPDGTVRHVESHVSPIKDDHGVQTGALLSLRDNTREYELAKQVDNSGHFAGIIGADKSMQEVFDLIRDVAEVRVPVLIQGESGTGKELVAAAIHNEGPCSGSRFIAVNCGALPESLLESELFGHVKGSFTGAVRDKKGRFELADGGTIFLDEIGDVTPAMQVKLLRVIQEGTFEPVGSEVTVKVNVRVISATNKDLTEEIAAGRFREDLFYRLSVVPVNLPPLRDRRTDIPLLVDHILSRYLLVSGKSGIEVSQEAMDEMVLYDWPGNVRELQNWIQFALVKCKTRVIGPEHLPPHGGSRSVMSRRNLHSVRLNDDIVDRAIVECRGNKKAAAEKLGVSRATLYRFFNSRRK